MRGPMTGTTRTLCLTALSISAGVGLAVAAVAIAGSPSHPPSRPDGAGSLKPARTLTPAENRQELAPSAKRALLEWGSRLAGCLATPQIALSEPRTARTEITIEIGARGAARAASAALASRMNHCVLTLGKPPREGTVTFDRGTVEKGRGTIRLFKPKTCPIPASPKKGSK